MAANWPDDTADDIAGKITSFLPITIAARSTLFSRELRHSWRQNRNLRFIRRPRALNHDNQYIELIDNVMSQHSGTKIDSLVLRLDPTGQGDRISQWIQMSVSKGVEEIDLDFSTGEEKIPISSNLMDSESSIIRILKLDSCRVIFSEQVSGFRCLKTLHFRNLTVTIPLMSSIVKNCLALENLDIRDCELQYRVLHFKARLLRHFKKLKVENYGQNCAIYIYSPSLEELDYSGEICDFVFWTAMPNLSAVTLTNLQSNQKFVYIPRVLRVMSFFRYCTNLQICGKLIQGLFPDFSGQQYRNFQWQPSWLRDLTLHLNGENISSSRGTSFLNPCDIIYFLDNCPSLENLIMNLGECSFGEGRFWKVEAKKRLEMCNPHFRSLKTVFIRGFKYRNLEFLLLRMIVEHAPSLHNVTLVQATDGDSTLDRDVCLKWMEAQRCRFQIQE